MVARVAILGGGISGLASAYYLKKSLGRRVAITLVEGSGRLGGWIETIEAEGFLFEKGPRSLRGRGHGLLSWSLAEELGLQPLPAAKAARKRFLLRNGRLTSLSLWNRRLLYSLLREPWRGGSSREESVDGFFRRRLGNYVADELLDPFVSGIFAGDPKQLSLKAAFPALHKWERAHGSLLRGAWHNRGAPTKPLFTFRKGLQELVNALVNHLDIELLMNERVVVKREGVVETSQRTLEVDYLVDTLPDLSLPRASVVVVNLGWNRKVLNREGFGYLVPSHEQENILGCVWDSSAFTEQNRSQEQTRLTVMMGGVRRPDLLELSSKELELHALDALQRHLGISTSPDAIRLFRQRSAIPQYPIGWRRPKSSERVIQLGSSYTGVGVNDCIAAAHKEMRALSQTIVYKQNQLKNRVSEEKFADV